MLRRQKLLTVNSATQQICCKLSETHCNCECPDCAGTCTDCVDCPNLTIADIAMWVYRSGNINPNNCVPYYLLFYTAFTFTDNVACFFIDQQLLDLPAGRYEGEIRVQDKKAGLINFQLGVPYSVCDPFVVSTMDGGNDMQPSQG